MPGLCRGVERKGGAKQRRKLLKDRIQRMPNTRRLARRGGVMRIPGLIYRERIPGLIYNEPQLKANQIGSFMALGEMCEKLMRTYKVIADNEVKEVATKISLMKRVYRGRRHLLSFINIFHKEYNLMLSLLSESVNRDFDSKMENLQASCIKNAKNSLEGLLKLPGPASDLVFKHLFHGWEDVVQTFKYEDHNEETQKSLNLVFEMLSSINDELTIYKNYFHYSGDWIEDIQKISEILKKYKPPINYSN